MGELVLRGCSGERGCAYEKPDARVVGLEAQDYVAVWSYEDGVSAHWGLCEGGLCAVFWVECACFVFGACDYLEGVAV